jgi:dTDP-4-amino-4,6-dideoxygalactose transaminase
VTDESRIIFGQPWFDSAEEELVLQTLRSGWIGQGPLVETFEQRFASYVGAPEVAAVSSCTAALHLSLLALGIGGGDEVITTPFTFVATVNAIEHSGATPVLVDIERSTRNISVDAIEAAITPRTRAIMPVHFAGQPCDTPALQAVADRHDLVVIEDAAHAVGAVADGTRVGGSANPRVLTCFSFYPNKNLAAPEGGAITGSNAEIFANIKRLRLHGLEIDAWDRYRTSTYRPSLAALPGYKYNWTDLQAAVGLAQLEKLEGFLAVREYLADRYDELLSGMEGVTVPARTAPGLAWRHALHLYQVEIDGDADRRNEIVAEMQRNGIGVAVHYIGVDHHPFYRGRWPNRFPESDRASDRLITLPLHMHLHDDELERVARELRRAVARTA